jgi:hypothetical protein
MRDEEYLGPTDASRKEILERYEMTPAEAGIPAAALAREADAIAAARRDEEDKGTCGCGKAAPAVVTKARGNRDYNSKEPEPRVPVSDRVVPNPANPGAVPSSSPARVIRDGLQASAAHQALAADQAHAGSGGSGSGDLGDRQLAVSSREASSGLSPALQAIDASRLAVQANGAPPLRGGKK